MATVVLPSYHLPRGLPSASISPPILRRLAPLLRPTPVRAHHSSSPQRLLLAQAKSQPAFAISSALASLSLEEGHSEEEEFDEDSELDLEEEDLEEDSDEDEEEQPMPRLSSERQEQALSSPSSLSLVSPPPPRLSVKEKKELTSYAHGLGKKLKTQQVGKFGVTPSVAASFVENLESNELLKIKIHSNCPSEFDDAVKELEKATGSVAISHIGRSVILYRPSIKKVKKKETVQGARKVWKPKPRGPYADAPSQTGRRSDSSDRSRRRSRV